MSDYPYVLETKYNQYYSRLPISDEIREHLLGNVFQVPKDSHYLVHFYGYLEVSPHDCFWLPSYGYIPYTSWDKVIDKDYCQGYSLNRWLRLSFPDFPDLRKVFVHIMNKYHNGSFKELSAIFEPYEKVIDFPFVSLRTRAPLSDKLYNFLKGELPGKIREFGYNPHLHEFVFHRLCDMIWLPSYGYVPFDSWRQFLGSDFVAGKKMLTLAVSDRYSDLDQATIRKLVVKINAAFHHNPEYVQLLQSSHYTNLRSEVGSGWRSAREQKFLDFYRNLGFDVQTNVRFVSDPDTGKAYELDLYFPTQKLAVEFNGCYWHSTHFKDKDYHRKKRLACLAAGVRLLSLWDYTPDKLCFSILDSKLGRCVKLRASKLELREVPVSERKAFFSASHIEGDTRSIFSLGLYYNNELYSCVSFRNHRLGLEIARFANKSGYQIYGAYSRLLKAAESRAIKLGYRTLVTYCDADLGFDPNTTCYSRLGFKFLYETVPEIKYFVESSFDLGPTHYSSGVYPRQLFQKHKLISLPNYDSSLTEEEILADYKVYRIYNSGNFFYTKDLYKESRCL